MEELQDKYDELENIEDTLRVLVDETSDKYYKELLMDIMYEAQREKEEIEPELIMLQNEEEMAMNAEFERSRL